VGVRVFRGYIGYPGNARTGRVIMPRASDIAGCINHPGFEATARCKQCGKPVCNKCRIAGPTGWFCSDVCKEKHAEFMKRAKNLNEARKPARSKFKGLTKLVGTIVFAALIVLAAGIAAQELDYEVPVIGGLILQIRETIGF
jgi:hypothetical protein